MINKITASFGFLLFTGVFMCAYGQSPKEVNRDKVKATGKAQSTQITREKPLTQINLQSAQEKVITGTKPELDEVGANEVQGTFKKRSVENHTFIDNNLDSHNDIKGEERSVKVANSATTVTYQSRVITKEKSLKDK